MSQTNVLQGDFPVVAGEDLTGKEDLLVKLVNDAGTLKARLPAANGDYAFFVLIEGNAADKNAAVRPLEPKRNLRLRLKGACNPGDVLVLADVATAADKGKVRVLPATAGTYRGLAIAEEVGVDGQLVRCRPAMIGNITV
ncbi:MAG TPA: hypothetical protein DCZ95_14970 [Verrucomicrobia bacterium]|nr:MAG: hypothetical protein A2X46_15560 [Lentisphaerae bacterium GWF2_57_35]HBA85387.1 hypothetical protein [Verrucomicrobiota bacterium]